MNDITANVNPILDKKMDYNTNIKNFSVPGELTVEITLQEYRELVTAVAVADAKVSEANNDKYKREREIEHLREEVATLKAELYELSKTKEAVTYEED